MTEAQKKFVDLEKRKDEYKQWLQELQEATQAVTDELGVGGYFQDDKGTVYKMVVPNGRWVAFETISYVRTKREGEAKGSLSVTEAREHGFEI